MEAIENLDCGVCEKRMPSTQGRSLPSVGAPAWVCFDCLDNVSALLERGARVMGFASARAAFDALMAEEHREVARVLRRVTERGGVS